MSKIPNILNFPNIHNIAKYVGGGEQFEPYFGPTKKEKRDWLILKDYSIHKRTSNDNFS